VCKLKIGGGMAIVRFVWANDLQLMVTCIHVSFNRSYIVLWIEILTSTTFDSCTK